VKLSKFVVAAGEFVGKAGELTFSDLDALLHLANLGLERLNVRHSAGNLFCNGLRGISNDPKIGSGLRSFGGSRMRGGQAREQRFNEQND
jgi:hypothetical protein